MGQISPFYGVKQLKSAEKGNIWAEFAPLSFLPCYFRDSQLSFLNISVRRVSAHWETGSLSGLIKKILI
jgi:hypothetical protein